MMRSLRLPNLKVAAWASKILSEIEIDERGHWRWKRSINAVTGYGQLRLPKAWEDRPEGKQGRVTLAHRFIWELLRGPIPDGHHIDHDGPSRCHTRDCVNPWHTRPLPSTENQSDGARARWYGRRGSESFPEPDLGGTF